MVKVWARGGSNQSVLRASLHARITFRTKYAKNQCCRSHYPTHPTNAKSPLERGEYGQFRIGPKSPTEFQGPEQLFERLSALNRSSEIAWSYANDLPKHLREMLLGTKAS